MDIYLMLFALLRVVTVVSSFTDSTLNKQGCNGEAFLGDDKYLTCKIGPKLRPALEECLNSSLEIHLPVGSRVEWCFNNGTSCFSNSSFQGSITMPQLEVLGNGMLHLRHFTFEAPENKRIECTYYSSEGVNCTATVNIDLNVHRRPSGYSKPIVLAPTVQQVDLMATIGRNLTLCIQVETRGLNGTAYWLVEGTRVDASAITTPVNVETYVPPDCRMCSCMKKKYETGLRNGFKSTNSPGLGALVVAFHRNRRQGNSDNDRKYLCDFPDTTLALLAVESVLPTAASGRMKVELLMADVHNQVASQLLQVATVFEQVADVAKVYPLSSPSLVLESGESAIIYCNATTAGNSSHMLSWARGSRLNLVRTITTNQSGWETPAELCTSRTGIFHMAMPPVLGQDLELDREGALFLIHRGALLVCNAELSFSGSYECFVNVSDGSNVIVQILKRKESFSSVAKGLLGVLAAMVVLVFAVLLCCVWRCRSVKGAPRQMAPCNHRPLASQSRVSATNQFFFEEPSYDQEFSREKLQLLKVLGEGEFGQVWKAVAEGICPHDANRSIVAVKTLKPSAGWSDKEDLLSELRIMVSIEPHPNIINFLGMCPETDHEPLYILMEYAMYGSLKDYLKKLSLGKSSFSHPLQLRACSCSCHSSGPRTSASREQTGDSPCPTQRLHPQAGPALSADSFVNNPEEAAHAARLLSLLDSNFDPPNSVRCLDELSEGSSECSCESGCCAYHPCAEECDYDDYYRGSGSDYYNRYYNHSGAASRADCRLACAGNEGSPTMLSPPLDYVNTDNEECRSLGKCACSREDYHYTYSEDRPNNEYNNVSSTGCAYCVLPDGRARPNGEAGPSVSTEGCMQCSCGNDRSNSSGKLSYFEFLDYAYQIARGMEHLENMKCVHRDLAARNVLIAEKFRLKIGDFGLTRDLSGENYYRKRSSGKIPARWMAVESLTEMKHTSKSDVWSYGVVLWEILTYGDLPYGKTPMARSIDSLAGFLKSGRRLSQPPPCSAPTYDIMKKCWHCDPGQRPSFTQLAESFRLVRQKSPGHFNRNLGDVPRQPEIAKLEWDIFQALIPVLSVHSPASQQLSDSSQLPPAYEEAVLMTRTGVSSTDSGCHMSYLDHSPGNSSMVPGGSNYCTPPSRPCSGSSTDLGESAAPRGLTEQDYLTLCQQDDQSSGSVPAGSQNQRTSVYGGDDGRAVCGGIPDREGEGETEKNGAGRSSLWHEGMNFSEVSSSPVQQTSIGSSSRSAFSSARIWKSIETEV